MARKHKEVKIVDRGTTKVFLITEMSAVRAEKWATKFFFAAANAGVQIPKETAEMGILGVLKLGLEGIKGIPYEKAEPLLEEMMTCVQIIPDPAHPELARGLVEEDIEDMTTLFKLKKEVFALHMDFSSAASP